MNTIELVDPIESITALFKLPLSMEELRAFIEVEPGEKVKCDIVLL